MTGRDCGVNSAENPCIRAIPSLAWHLDVEAPVGVRGDANLGFVNGNEKTADLAALACRIPRISSKIAYASSDHLIPHQLYCNPELYLCISLVVASAITLSTNSPQSSPPVVLPAWIRFHHDLVLKRGPSSIMTSSHSSSIKSLLVALCRCSPQSYHGTSTDSTSHPSFLDPIKVRHKYCSAYRQG